MAKRGPTARQRRAVLDTLANLGPGGPTKTKKEIMLAAGYSPAMAKNPKMIEASKGWFELMEEYLPDSFLAEKHRALLDKMDADTGQVDTQAVKAGLDLAYKAKRKIGSDQPAGGGSLTINVISYNNYGDNTPPPLQA